MDHTSTWSTFSLPGRGYTKPILPGDVHSFDTRCPLGCRWLTDCDAGWSWRYDEFPYKTICRWIMNHLIRQLCSVVTCSVGIVLSLAGKEINGPRISLKWRQEIFAHPAIPCQSACSHYRTRNSHREYKAIKSECSIFNWNHTWERGIRWWYGSLNDDYEMFKCSRLFYSGDAQKNSEINNGEVILIVFRIIILILI